MDKVEQLHTADQPPNAVVPICPLLLDRVEELYLRGLNLQAYDIARQTSPIEHWTGPAARIMAGRLANNLGAPRLGLLHHIRAYQEDPTHPNAIYYYARTLLERKGPYACWRFLKQNDDAMQAIEDRGIRADWLAFTASVAAMFRDFGTAEPLIRQALNLLPDRPWLWIEQSYIHQQQDRSEEALADARRSMELRPWFRPGVQTVAAILVTFNRDDEALDLLREANTRIESGHVAAQLAGTLTEHKRYTEADPLWERVVELSPLADRDFKRFIAGRRSDAAYFRADYPAAADHARDAGKGFFEKMAQRLSRDLTGKTRIELDIPFVQQHHMTCAPATLSAISRYWERPAAHLDIVEAICFDGTPAHSERAWAEKHGFICREFRVTWESTIALIDRGIPFTLTTVEATSAHLQAVIGYDSRRETLLIRDPGFKYTTEALADAMFDRYKASGPRGMAMVPADRPHLLDQIDLPEVALYNAFNLVQKALMAHQRDQAVAATAQLESLDADHRLTLTARRSLAYYDADPQAQLNATERLLALFPEEPSLRMQRLGLLRNLARRSEIVDALARFSSEFGCDPVFIQHYAQELGADPRQLPRAEKLLRKCLRLRPGDCGSYFILANQLWAVRGFNEAMDLYRFATCLNDKDEQLASTYFGAARHFKRTAEALELLRDRFARYAARSALPTRILFQALLHIDRATDAFNILEEGLAKRPDDGDLLLHAADAFARYGNHSRAAQLIDLAAGKVHASQLRRARASLDNYEGELAAALQQWQEILRSEPLAMDAHSNIAQLLAETQGRDAALAHLREATKRFEHHFPLHQLLMSWLRADHVPELEQVIRRLLESRPGDAWLVRELAIAQFRQGNIADASSSIRLANELEPTASSSHSITARIYAASGRQEEALSACRQALLLSIDNDDAMHLLMDLSLNVAQRREALAFICEQLVKQVTYGEGLLAYRSLATSTLDGEEALKTLDEALQARPDLWHAWSARTRQLADVNRLEEALAAAKDAVAHFPLHARLWLDLADIHASLNDAAAEIESLNKVLQISPGWGAALRALANAHSRQGNFEQAQKVLEDAIAWAPLDAANHGTLAESLWKQDKREQAVETLRKALILAPGYDWAWSALRQWGSELKRPDLAADMARELTARRPGEARSWFTLARVINGDDSLEQRLAALDKAIALEPLEIDFHDYRAAILSQANRHDEALVSCKPAVFSHPPVRLQGRAAWVTARSGNPQQAIEQMRAVVAEDPRYVWAWNMLADWYRETGRDDDYFEAACTLANLTPLDAMAWGYLGEAHERKKEMPAAKAAFARAVDLDPAYAFAGYSLFDLQLQDNDLAAARQTLDRISLHHDSSLGESRRVQLLCRQNDCEAASSALNAMLVIEDLDPTALDMAIKAVDDAGWRHTADRVMELALAQPNVNVLVSRLWVARATLAHRTELVEQMIDRLWATAPDSELTRRTLCNYLGELGRNKLRSIAHRFIRKHTARLRIDSQVWGMVGCCYTDLHDYRLGERWFADWEQRQDIEQWMLANLVECLHAVGKPTECARACRVGLGLGKSDHGRVWLHMWLAFDATCEGRFEEAQKHLAQVPIEAVANEEILRVLHKVTTALLDPALAHPREPFKVFPLVRKGLAAARTAIPTLRSDRGHRRILHRAARAAASRYGGFSAFLYRIRIALNAI